MQYDEVASVPMKSIGPMRLTGNVVEDEVMVPLATYETPLWPSTNRGAKVSRLSGGINVSIAKNVMTRSVVVEATNATRAIEIANLLQGDHFSEVAAVVSSTSNHARLEELNFQFAGNLLYIRVGINSGAASGHNMVTSAAEAVLNWVLTKFADLKYVSISGNYCIDKKASAVNGILGRGKYVVADILIPKSVCESVLKTTASKVVELHIRKNLMGSMLAGSLRSANAHFANMLLALYMATGQDAANIVEGSQGYVHCETRGDDLYFSVTLPNVIVGTIGNGKHLDFAKENLKKMGCLNPNDPDLGSCRLAAIVAGTVLCGELSLLAAQTNPGELMRTHFSMERAPKDTEVNQSVEAEI